MSPLIFSDSFIFENWISKSRSLEKEYSSLEAVIDKYFFYSTKIFKIQNRFIEKKISHAVVFFPQCTAKVWILKKDMTHLVTFALLVSILILSYRIWTKNLGSG